MSEASYPAVGLQVDFDDFARLDGQIDRAIESYGKLHAAAEKASKPTVANAGAERSKRVAQEATNAQLMSVSKIMAAQRGLASFQDQQAAATLRTQMAMTKQQVTAAEQAARGESTARAKSLADFRKMMSERIALGQAAGRAEETAAKAAFELRKRLNTQQASEVAKRVAAESAAAAKAEKDASDAAAAAARERERAAAYVHRLKVQYFIDEQRAQEKAERDAVKAAERAAKEQATAAAQAAKAQTSAETKALSEFRQMMDQRVALGRAAAKADEAQAQSTLDFRRRMNAQRAREEAQADAEAIRRAKELERAQARARSQAQTAPIVRPADINLLDAARTVMARFGAATEGLRTGLHRLRVAFFDLRTMVSLFLGGMIVGPIVRFADAMVALEARVGFFAKSQADVPYLFEAVYQTAQRARAPLEAVGTLYTRLAPLADQLGKSQLQLLKITETVQKGIAIGGATGAEATSSAQQLAQALASNRLGGDELRSLAENAPILLSAIARELNMNSGEFIKWAHSGKANAQVVVDAIEKAAPRIDALFAKFPVTIGQGVTMVTNAVQKLVGEVNSATKAGEQIGAAFVDFSVFLGSADTISAVTAAVNALMLSMKGVGLAINIVVDALPVIAALLGVLAVRAVMTSAAVQGIGVAFATTAVMLGPSATVMTVATTTLSAAVTRLGVAAKTALGFIGGPFGAAILIAAGAFAVFQANALSAQEAVNKFDAANQGAASAMDRALSLMEAYGADTKEMTQLLLDLNGVQESQVEGLDDAGKAAVARAENERTLTVALLRRAAAEQVAAAASLERGAIVTKIQRISQQLNPEVAGARLARGDNDPLVAANDASVAELKQQEEFQKTLAAKLRASAPDTMKAADILEAAKFTVKAPDAKGSGQGANTPDIDKNAARRAASLARELKAMEATAAANLKLADAWGQGEAAAWKQQAAVEATGRAIKRQGDVDKFVAAQMNINAAEAAAQAAQDVFMLNRKTRAQEAANEAVRKGEQTAQAAAEQMAINLDLATMQAQADAASGPARDRLLQSIKDKRQALEQANQTERDAQILAERAAARDDAAIVQREIELIGKSNREKAISLAMLQKELDLRARGPLTPDGAEAIIQAGVDADQQVTRDEKLDAYNDGLRLQADLLAQIADHARAAGSGLVEAFGQGAAALAGLLEVMTTYEAKQAAIAQARKEYTDRGGQDAQRLAMFDKDAAQAQVQHYGDMAGAAKKLFSERSRGYQVLSAAEKAFRLYEFAMSAKSIAVKSFEVAAKVGLFGVQAQAAAAAGAAEIFAALGPAGFPVVAAMVATLAGLGLALSGGAGGGSAPGATDMADRQAAQGAGSVLGDVEAKSESLSRALELVAANSNKDLEYSNAMLKALQAIEDGIGAVAAGLARSLGVGGMLDTAGLNLGQTSKSGGLLATVLGGVGGFVLSKILPDWFGTKTTRTLQDQGLQFGSQNLGDILSGGIDGQTYQQVLENTKKKVFGITYSDKNKVSTTTGSLDADFTGQITALIGSLRGAVLAGADTLGVQGAEAVLDAFQVNLGKLSFKDMSGEEIQAALNAIFSKLGDDLAATAIPALKNLQQVGEGAFETLARVSRNYVVLNTALESIGMSFGAVGVASLEAREYLIDLAGGIDKLVEQTGYFAENFLSDLERMAPIQKAVTAELARLGLQGVTTKEQFKDLVLGLDLSTQAGAEMYAALMALAPAFAKVVEFQTAGSKAVQDARDALSKAYERERSALQATIDKFAKLAETLKDFRESLTTGQLALNPPGVQYDLTRQKFFDAAGAAAGGDAEAMAALPALGKDFLEASKNYSVTLVDYQRDLALVRNAVQAAEDEAVKQVSLGEQQLEALKAQVDGLIVLNESVLSVAQAIIALQGALAAQTAATLAAQQAAQTQTPAPAANDNPSPQTTTAQDWAAYIANNSDVAAEYARNMASAKGSAYLASLNINSAADFGQWHYNEYGQYENRNVPTYEVPLTREVATSVTPSANDNGSGGAQMDALIDRVEDLITGIEQVAVNTGASLRLNKRWDGDGMPETRSIA